MVVVVLVDVRVVPFSDVLVVTTVVVVVALVVTTVVVTVFPLVA